MNTFKYFILFALLFPASLLAERSNVILIISDDHAWTDYGFLGHEKIRSPHIDQLATEGLTFTRGYVTTALCQPADDVDEFLCVKAEVCPWLSPIASGCFTTVPLLR